MTRKQKKMLARILIAGSITVALHFLPVFGIFRFCLYLIPYLIAGHDILRKAWYGICNRQLMDENFLMVIATLGALLIGLVQTGDYTEAVAVMLFYQLGELFQSYAVGKSRRNISQLMDIRPDYANIEQDGVLLQVDPDSVATGSIIVVQPGEKVPIDGIVVDGSSTLDTKALTGESLPRDVQTGAQILSGCINLTGVLKIQTTRPFGQSTVSKILELVENASSNKSRSENFISRFARIYTPAVCISALLLAILPPAISLLSGHAANWIQWLYRALSFLVASCPCALVISIPLSFFGGIGGASRQGILIKGSNYLEALSKAGTVVFDKTGTLTCGSFEVTGIYHNTIPSEQLIRLAALAESASSHPISKSLLRAWGGQPDRSQVTDIQEYSGQGVTATVDGQLVAAGNEKLMAKWNIAVPKCPEAGTLVYVAVNGVFSGVIVISDRPKDNAKAALDTLKAMGIRKLVMLTGDSHAAAKKTAQQLGIEEFYSQLLPADKVSRVEQLLNQSSQKLVFVGDGINDAPVLSRSDIGIAMGAMGSDAAIEAADIVLMDDDPMKLATAISISRKTLRIVYQNIVFAIGIKILALVLVALGAASMWLAIFADVGVMVLAVLNAIRTLLVNK